MKSIAILFMSLATTVYAEGIYDSSQQRWEVDGVFAQILGESADLFPELSFTNYQGAEQLDTTASTCTATVQRPGYSADAVASAQNTFICSLEHKDGSVGSMTFELSQVPFQAWGNRPSEHYWHQNGRPKPFQIHFKEGFNDDINMRLVKAMLRREEAGDPHISSYVICGPGGTICSGSVTFATDAEAPERQARLLCSIDTEGDVIYKTRCIFQFPR